MATSWRSTRSSTSLCRTSGPSAGRVRAPARRSNTATATKRWDHAQPAIIAGQRPRPDCALPALTPTGVIATISTRVTKEDRRSEIVWDRCGESADLRGRRSNDDEYSAIGARVVREAGRGARGHQLTLGTAQPRRWGPGGPDHRAAGMEVVAG